MDERISEVKNTISELISNIIPRIDTICRTYNDTDTFEAERLQYLFDDLQALAEGMDFLKEYYESIDLFELQEKLDMLERALDENDRMLFIDIMQYELKSLLEFWREILI